MDLNKELQHRLSHDKGLKLIQLDKFDNAQMLSLLHLWITHLNLLVPSKSRLQSIIDHVIFAKSDAQPSVSIGNGDIRRHGPAIYWVEAMQEVGSVPLVDIRQSVFWPGIGRLGFIDEIDGADRLKNNLPDLNWRLRVGGEMLRPLGRSKQRDLKRLFQEYRHKPWLRDRTPLLYSGDELVAVGDILISANHAAENSEPGIRLIWDISAKAD
jgi:tRNA(Ile)-lysidine synthase